MQRYHIVPNTLKTWLVFHIRKSPHTRDGIWDGANIRRYPSLDRLAPGAQPGSKRPQGAFGISSGAVRLDSQQRDTGHRLDAMKMTEVRLSGPKFGEREMGSLEKVREHPGNGCARKRQRLGE